MPKTVPCRVLFLCTGNYYRSRFAEILFNHLASRAGLNWLAFSRALAIELGKYNVGPISVHTREACAARNLALPEPLPFPQPLTLDDLQAAHQVIALKEAEHRGYLQQNFHAWVDRVRYWHVHDLDGSGPAEACAEIERQVSGLVTDLMHAR